MLKETGVWALRRWRDRLPGPGLHPTSHQQLVEQPEQQPSTPKLNQILLRNYHQYMRQKSTLVAENDELQCDFLNMTTKYFSFYFTVL